MGANPAATVAASMINTFQSIRFGLMVGIGGGFPSKVSLGDVVVSQPVADYHGVVQWDMGKLERGGRFVHICDKQLMDMYRLLGSSSTGKRILRGLFWISFLCFRLNYSRLWAILRAQHDIHCHPSSAKSPKVCYLF